MKQQDHRSGRERLLRDATAAAGQEGTGEHSESGVRGEEAGMLEWTRSPLTESFTFMRERAKAQKEGEQRGKDSEPDKTVNHFSCPQLACTDKLYIKIFFIMGKFVEDLNP